MCSALTYHVEFRVTSVRALAWGPFLIPSPFIPISTQQSCPIQALKCPKFQIKKITYFWTQTLSPHYISHHPFCFLYIVIAKPISINYYRGDIKETLWKETWRTIRMYLYWHQMHMRAVLKHPIHLSHLISLQGQFHSLLDVCKLMFHMNHITLIKQITLERHLEQNKI